jgi:alpha-N-arabinofuranosidase
VRVVVSGPTAASVSRQLFGANLLWPYGGGGSFDTATGAFYPGFVKQLRALRVTSMRYPGGTTADSFDWERAIGPARARRANEPYGMQGASLSHVCCVLDGPVASVVGPDEFGRLLQQAGATGDIVANFATGTAQEAAAFVAYMTAPLPRHPSATPTNPSSPGYWAALRARNGHRAPYDVPYWEVGNEQLFPGQYGWRSGALVSFTSGSPPCPAGQTATCLYAFGGTTRFSRQLVGRFADTVPGASISTGLPGQTFYLYYPPVVARSQTVMVSGHAWRQVRSLAKEPADAHVYELSPTTGKLTFGGGAHGAAPAKGAVVTASYASGPHAGFVGFYRAMKHMNPKIHVCESEETNVAFLRLMGSRYRYDCVELHEYAAPKDVLAPVSSYAEQLMSYPATEAATLARLQEQIRRYSGSNVPVYLTEYGQLVWPVPSSDRQFLLSLDEALLAAVQVREWALAGVPVADRYLVTSSPFLSTDPRRVSIDSLVRVVREREGALDWDAGLSIDSAMVAGPGPRFVVEPTALALQLVSALGGGRLMTSRVEGAPLLAGSGGQPALLSLASQGRSHGRLVVIDTSQSRAVRALVTAGQLHRGHDPHVWLLDGPSGAAYNTPARPRTVNVTGRALRAAGATFEWTFPPHSITLFVF